MSDSTGDLANNPFAALNPADFPKNRKPGSGSGQEPNPAEEADAAIFRRAVERFTKEKREERGGFRLGEQCRLPVMASKKKTRKKAASHEADAVSIPDPGEDLFAVAMRSVAPLSGKGRDIAPRPDLRPPTRHPEDTLENFMAGKLDFAVSSSGEYLEGHVAGLDELILNRLREGQFSPEANLDLHGLNSEQAFESLREFMRQAWLKDLRVVLLVPGRGRNSPDGHGILRDLVQRWLTREPFKRIVLAFCTARPHDGGPGSIYVLLRRFRKKGRIQWDRIYVED